MPPRFPSEVALLPTAFLSLSGADDAFVGRVHALLPDALAYFYPRSFENGENLIQAMEERVGQASIFALFASKASLGSKWVRFEIDRARIRKILNPNLRVLVFTIDSSVTHSDLPDWMKEFWVPGASNNARDIARYIRNTLLDTALSKSPLAEPIGRGKFTDDAVTVLQNRFLTTREMPNVFVFAGHTGIGRQTVLRKFLKVGFPGNSELTFGPSFQLPQFADSADLYRGLRQEIDPEFSVSSYQRDSAAFQGMSPDEQAEELARSIEHFGIMGQAVTIVTGNGIFVDSGLVKPWVVTLFKALATKKRAKLCIVSNRLLHPNELAPHVNVLQLHVPGLTNENIETLIIATCQMMGIEPQLPNQKIIQAIGVIRVSRGQPQGSSAISVSFR